ncbi:LacI family DNA-binding transcriptional regulator [Tumebacillus sp. ITR2]|uniref:LacI family DNA-binding transcriptional regulator n=1 Tax=Tumebacillus amylolyticus TaxID=2801339 RepID=A0ABS1J4U3_9BACL|nr:LacI family DNA-binding transcriptional regulator [Tumebacillus amylolyticus]MBL0385054.1 LacI family DNA-binding transcriptional regulator [Tumebacillus amylolyticus]
MNPSIRDVAKKANVSISTVSRVFNNPESVNQEMRERVLQVIEELGYAPNPFASGLRDNRSKVIVTMIPDIRNSYYAEMLSGIEEVALSNRYTVIIGNTIQNEERFLEYVKNFVKMKVDGLIFASTEITEFYQKNFEALKIPVILASTEGREWNLPSVRVNDYQASYEATAFLIQNGHQDIGFISGPTHAPIAGRERYEGFLGAMAAHELPTSEQNVVYSEMSFDAGYEAMAKLYAKMPHLTAVYAASDSMAIGAMKFLHEQGLEVPRHVSVMGFDNLEISRMVSPGLTTVAQQIYEIGKTAGTMLFQAIENREEELQSVTIDHEIIVRGTVRNRRLMMDGGDGAFRVFV